MKPSKEYTLKNGQSLLVRAALEKDAAEIISYIDQVSGESDNITFGKGEFNISIEEEQKLIRDFLAANNQLFIVGIVDNRIVSVTSFRAGGRKRVSHAGEFGITVLKEFWGLGVGRQMIDYLIEWAKSTNQVTKINLKVREDNQPAIELYKKAGFIQEGIITRDMCIDGKYINSLFMGLCID